MLYEIISMLCYFYPSTIQRETLQVLIPLVFVGYFLALVTGYFLQMQILYNICIYI